MALLPRSLPRICVALGFSTAEELGQSAACEFKDGNTFLEFRLDCLTNPASGIKVIENFTVRYPEARVLATCRHHDNHGGFKGAVAEQIAVLKRAAEAGAFAVDLEIESAEHFKSESAVLRKDCSLIISFHDFSGTPALQTVYRRLQRIPADAYKLVTTIRKPGDTARILRWLRQEAHQQPLVALGMGEGGAPTRILSPSLGCVYTYAAPAEAAGTAPGQISSKLMRGLYRCEKLTPETKIYGVIADPVSHSKSPLIHNKGFHSRRLDAVYLPFLVASSQLGDWMKLAAELPVAGFSVTIPHKQRILRYLDAVDPLAKRIGAVNTVWRKAGKWRGTNTDINGILKPLGRHLRLPHASVLIAGYGGAARAAAFSLCDAGAKVTITGRDVKRAQALARAVRADAVTLDNAALNEYDVLIHATPVGMSPDVEGCLFTGKLPAAIVFDMVYNPHETALLKAAKQQGCTVIHGIEMLVEQAARQFEIWTGESAPVSVMQNALT